MKYKKPLNPARTQLYCKVRDAPYTGTNNCESVKYIFITLTENKYIFIMCSSVFHNITAKQSQKMELQMKLENSLM